MNKSIKNLVLFGGVLALVVGTVLSGRWLYFRLTHVSTDAAYVKADLAEVAPEVSGQVLAVLVEEGARVEQGQVLVKLEGEAPRHAREQAESKVKQLEETIRRQEVTAEKTGKLLETGEKAALAAVEAAKAQVGKAKAFRDYMATQEARLAALLAEKAIPKARYDEVHAAAVAAQADMEAATQALAAAKAKLEEVKAQRLALKEALAGVAEARSGLAQATAALEQARWAENKVEVRAPIPGVIARIFVRPGDFASPGRPILVMYDPATRYVEARFEETKIKSLAVGRKARLRVDALPGLELLGTIRRVTPAAAQEFALIPRDVTAGEFTKVTQRVPVELAIDDLSSYPEVVPGLSVQVAVAKKR